MDPFEDLSDSDDKNKLTDNNLNIDNDNIDIELGIISKGRKRISYIKGLPGNIDNYDEKFKKLKSNEGTAGKIFIDEDKLLCIHLHGTKKDALIKFLTDLNFSMEKVLIKN